MYLFIVRTDFQLKLVESIIDYKNIDLFYIIFIKYSSDNYIGVNKGFKQIESVEIPLSKFNILSELVLTKRLLIRLIKIAFNTKITSIAFASVDLISIRIISFLWKHKIFTFDDGLANVIETSIYMRDNYPFLQLTGIPKPIDIINAGNHFTYYRDLNFARNTTVLRYPVVKGSVKLEYKIKILVGSPLFSDNEVILALQRYNLDFYMPHPREKLRNDYIKTFILDTGEINNEDWIGMRKGDVILFGAFSSLIVNAKLFYNVECFYIDLVKEEELLHLKRIGINEARFTDS